MRKRHIDVTEWQAFARPPIPEFVERRSVDRTHVAVLVAVLSIHCVLVLALSFGASPARLALPLSLSSNGVAALEIKMIDGPPRSATSAIDGVPPIRLLPPNMPILLEAPPPAVERLLTDDESSGASAERTDPQLAEANAIYTRQILARIERVWQHPGDVVGHGSADAQELGFECQAQLEQDAEGNVKEVLLPRCTGDETWRHSLLVAIRRASPLPAPPDPRVFSTSLVLHFVRNRHETGNDPAHSVADRSLN